MRGGKGPIFEDGPNFDMAFRLFHGRDGVVPLSGRSYVPSENLETDPPAPQFNPLAAKAATISLSGFGAGGPFSFDAFSQKWNNQKKKSESSKKQVNPVILILLQFIRHEIMFNTMKIICPGEGGKNRYLEYHVLNNSHFSSFLILLCQTWEHKVTNFPSKDRPLIPSLPP